MGVAQDLETHTGCYHDVTRVPADVLAHVAGFVSREWGGGYLMGYVGSTRWDERPDETTYVFQVKASDGSRLAVAASEWGSAFELTGTLWLAWLQTHNIEATVRGCGS
jgi:hypothetical protein